REFDAELAAFRDEMKRFRQGDATVLDSLRKHAEKLCASYQRCEGKEQVTFYERMSGEDRKRGLAEEAEDARIYRQAQDASGPDLEEQEWVEICQRAVDDLQAIAARAEKQPDFSPAARCLGLCAHLELARVGIDSRLTREQREELLASAERDSKASIS